MKTDKRNLRIKATQDIQIYLHKYTAGGGGGVVRYRSAKKIRYL